jgi:UDP-N-acetylmuramate dehydrogenase
VSQLVVTENAPLGARTTLGVGGNARYLTVADSETSLQASLAFARRRHIPIFLLGGGSNLVVSDDGFRGLVIVNEMRGIKVKTGSRQEVIVTAGAGEDWDRFVQYTVDRDWQGVECLAGIPGKVGASPVQNVGAYGQEVAETLVSVRALDLWKDSYQDLARDECRFSYRRSRFNADPAEVGRWIITGVTYRLLPWTPPALKYADVQKYFADAPEPPTVAQVADAVRKIRADKGMVIRADDPDSRSAGSFFKNPVVTMEQSEEIAEEAEAALPCWPQPDGNVKLSAAWLIEQAGFRRGESFGRVGSPPRSAYRSMSPSVSASGSPRNRSLSGSARTPASRRVASPTTGSQPRPSVEIPIALKDYACYVALSNLAPGRFAVARRTFLFRPGGLPFPFRIGDPGDQYAARAGGGP